MSESVGRGRRELGDRGAVHSSNKVGKVPGRFLHSISHAKGTVRGGKKPHAAFKAGKEANWSTVLGV